MEKEKKELTKTELYEKQNKTDKVLFILYDNSCIARKNITHKYCYPVTTVTNVTSNTSNKGNKVTPGVQEEWDKEYNQIKVILNRLLDRNLVKRDESKQPYKYELTKKGKDKVEKKYKEYKEEINKVLERKKEKEKEERLEESWENYLTTYVESKIRDNKRKNKNYIHLDLMKLSKEDPLIADQVLDEPIGARALSEIIIKRYYNINGDFNVYFYNLPESEKINVNSIRAKHLEKMVYFVGEIKSRSQTTLDVLSIKFQCPSCGNIITKLQLGQTITEPKSCGCGRKSKFKEIDRKITDSLRLNVSDLYEEIDNKEVIEEINVLMKEDAFNFSQLSEGDRVRVIGIPQYVEIRTGGGRKTTMEKMITCCGLEKLEEDYTKQLITEDDEEEIQKIAKNPIEYHHKALFHDLHGIELPAKLAIISLYGNLNILMAGDPGVGKSQIQKRCAEIALRGRFVNCISATESGILGSVTKNKFTGKYSLDGGALRPMHPGGKVMLDELNRDTDKNVQKAILGVMADRRLNIHKANTRVDTACYVNIWASVNPTGSIDDQKEDYENFGMLHPLWDRFDFKVYFINKLDVQNDELMNSLITDAKRDYDIDENKKRIIKKYQIKASHIKVKFRKEDIQKLRDILQQFYDKIDSDTTSFRKIYTMKETLRGICRLHQREYPIDSDYQLMTDLIKDLYATEHIYKSEDVIR